MKKVEITEDYKLKQNQQPFLRQIKKIMGTLTYFSGTRQLNNRSK